MTDHQTSEAAGTGYPMAAEFERYHSAGPATPEDLDASFKCLRDIVVDEVDFGIFTSEEALAVIEKLHLWLLNEARGRRRAIVREQLREALAALPDWDTVKEGRHRG